MFDKPCNNAIRESLTIESPLLRIKISQLRRFGILSRMLQELLLKQTLYAEVIGKKPVGQPRTRWFDYIEDFGWNHLGLYLSRMQSVLVDQLV